MKRPWLLLCQFLFSDSLCTNFLCFSHCCKTLAWRSPPKQWFTKNRISFTGQAYVFHPWIWINTGPPQTCVEQDLAQPEPFKGNLGPQNALQRQNPSFLASYNALGSPRKTAPVAFRGFKGVKNANFIAFFWYPQRSENRSFMNTCIQQDTWLINLV